MIIAGMNKQVSFFFCGELVSAQFDIRRIDDGGDIFVSCLVVS